MLCCRHCGEGESERIDIQTLLQLCGEQLCKEYKDDPDFCGWARVILGIGTEADALSHAPGDRWDYVGEGRTAENSLRGDDPED